MALAVADYIKSADNRGTSRDEIVEAEFMAVIMHGSPVYMFMNSIFGALDEFLPKQKGK